MYVTKIIWNFQDNFTLKAIASMEYDIVCMAARTKLPNMDADDIAQELRFRLFSQSGSFNPLKASYRTWAMRVLRNHIRNLHRDLSTTHKRKANLNLLPLENWLEIGNSNVKDLDVMLAMRKLPKLEKAVIFCKFFKRMSIKQIAKRIKHKQKDIKAIENNAKILLKELLA